MSKKLTHDTKYTTRENTSLFTKPHTVIRAPWNGLVSVRWFKNSAGAFCASQKIGPGAERFAFVTRSQPYTLEFKQLAQYPDYRLFSTDEADIKLWSNQWFSELEPFYNMFMTGKP